MRERKKEWNKTRKKEQTTAQGYVRFSFARKITEAPIFEAFKNWSFVGGINRSYLRFKFMSMQINQLLFLDVACVCCAFFLLLELRYLEDDFLCVFVNVGRCMR